MAFYSLRHPVIPPSANVILDGPIYILRILGFAGSAAGLLVGGLIGIAATDPNRKGQERKEQ